MAASVTRTILGQYESSIEEDLGKLVNLRLLADLRYIETFALDDTMRASYRTRAGRQSLQNPLTTPYSPGSL